MKLRSVISVVVVLGILILVFNVFSISNESFTGRAMNIEDCKDGDGGIEADVGGILIGSYDPTKSKRDYCVNRTTLGEYYCDEEKSDGSIEEIFCDSGCILVNGLGECKKAEVKKVECSEGCEYNEKCVPVGIRVNGKYCDYDKIMKNQKIGECESDYECRTNFCVNKRCITEEEWGNFLEDIKKTYWWE